ncbi:hypothetical protein Tsubulata_000254 [Turnera subulata]|uniref:Cytochrome c oxidase subunit n=1 Tax=Turnera subulata TaxID=218843 RepID=A0A9Q0FYZ1_9ROSI|nr:hypothetical protein Tsubulata_000254 [Turnera subulata]
MAMAMMRSSHLRNTTLLRSGCRSSAPPKRGFASTSQQHEDAQEAAKWQKITFLGITTCFLLACNVLSKGHHHHEEPPAYQYLHIRSKEFPWGPDGLFELKRHDD